MCDSLSSRSAKDSTVAGALTQRLFEQFYAECKDKNANSKLICVNKAHIQALKTTDAASCFKQLLASERILDDLDLALEHPESWSQKLVVREWVGVPLSHEFRYLNQMLECLCLSVVIRGFVFGGSLCALSQYYIPWRCDQSWKIPCF